MAVSSTLRVLLDELETSLKERGYYIRTSKGSFRSNSCLIKQSKIILVNKALDTESKYSFLKSISDTLDHA